MIEKSVPPRPTGRSKAYIFSYAEHQASRLKYEPGDDLNQLVSRLGGKIRYISPSVESPDSIVVKERRNFTIFLSSFTSPIRDRFTIAHELGHYALHYPMVQEDVQNGVTMKATRWVDEEDKSLVRCEWEANWFAAAFLMPADRFKKDFNGDASAVAQLYGVSEAAAKIRAQSLGLL